MEIKYLPLNSFVQVQPLLRVKSVFIDLCKVSLSYKQQPPFMSDTYQVSGLLWRSPEVKMEQATEHF